MRFRRALLQGTLGILLIGASLVGVVMLTGQNSETRVVAIAQTSTSVGANAADIAIDFVEVSAHLTLIPAMSPEEWDSLSGMVSERSFREGDPVSLDDFSSPENSDLKAITLDLAIGRPPWLNPGQRVVLWVAPPISENSFSAPFVLSPNALIESVIQDEGFAADGTLRMVTMRVSGEDLPGVVHALANNYFLYPVPAD